MKRYAVPLAILLTALAVYGWRFSRDRRPQKRAAFHLNADQDLVMDSALFNRILEQTHPEWTVQAAATLLVFFDPENHCPAYLDEAPFWFESERAELRELVRVVLVVPHTASQESADYFCEYYGLPKDRIRRTGGEDPMRIYHAAGVLKVLYGREYGVIWSQPGSDRSEDHFEFSARLEREADTYFHLE